VRRCNSSSSSRGRGSSGSRSGGGGGGSSSSSSSSGSSSAGPGPIRPTPRPPFQASGGCITTGKARATSSSSATGSSASARCDTYLQYRRDALRQQAASRTQLGLLSSCLPASRAPPDPYPTPCSPHPMPSTPTPLDAPGAHHLPGQGEAAPSTRHAALAATGPAATAHNGRRHRPVPSVCGAGTGGRARRRAASNCHRLACRCAGPASGDARVRWCRVRRAGARSRRSCRLPRWAAGARPCHPCRPAGRVRRMVRRRGARRGVVCLVCLRRSDPELWPSPPSCEPSNG